MKIRILTKSGIARTYNVKRSNLSKYEHKRAKKRIGNIKRDERYWIKKAKVKKVKKAKKVSQKKLKKVKGKCYEVIVNGIDDLGDGTYKEIDSLYLYFHDERTDEHAIVADILDRMERNGIHVFRTATMRLNDKNRVDVALRSEISTTMCKYSIDDIEREITRCISSQPVKQQLKKYPQSIKTKSLYRDAWENEWF